MEKSTKIALRFGATVVALGLGIAIVIGLTYVGEQSTGPVEAVMRTVSEQVTHIENTIVQEAREETRQESLKWFDTYRRNPDRMKTYRKVFWGAYDNDTKEGYNNIIRLEDSLGIKLPIIQIYVAWGSKTNEQFPFTKVKAIYDLGSMPMITWEPWLNDFSQEEYPGIAEATQRDAGCLAAIASGTYDAYIDEFATQCKRFGATLIIRLGHEMNDPYRYPWGPQNNKNTDFTDMWKHVQDRFRKAGAHNVQWMWSPHPAYYNYGEYYPGDTYVDWVGVPALNYGTVAPWSKWWSFDDIFGNYYKYLAMFNKPIMVTEFATLNAGGSRSEWYHQALKSFKKYPLLKSVLFFHSRDDNTTTYKSLNWQIVDDRNVVKTLRAEIDR